MNKSKPIESEKDLDVALKKADRAFVLFYASWCPFSRKFLPVYDKFSTDKKNRAVCVKADDMDSLCEKYSVSVYPTVLFFKKGKVVKRLDGIAGEGLSEKQLADFIEGCR
jgi:thiol-disulfide isomerase/thioredoxin